MPKAGSAAWSKALSLYDKLVATCPGVERKGATMPYTSANGHMFSILSKGGALGLRLAKEEREAFLEKYETELLVNYGVVMKEYVEIPGSLLERTEELKPFFALSVGAPAG